MASLRPAFKRFCSSCLSSRRSFTTSSARRKGHLPTFQPTSSPALDELLSTLRSNIFLPAQLSEAQRKLVFQKKNHHILMGEEPATAAIGSEVVQMVPLNHLRDEPNTDASIRKVLDLMGEAGDGAWQNLPGFLIGLKSAKRKLKGYQMVKIARRACLAKKEGLVRQCCMRVTDTGLGLWEPAVVRELMWAASRRAHEGGWEGDGLKRGLEFAEGVWSMLQEPLHQDLKPKDKAFVDPLRRPEVVGVLVQLHAAKTAAERNKTDTLKKYVKILLATWNKDDLGTPENWHDANQKLMMWTPVWHGMKTARQLLDDDPGMRKELGIKLVKDVEPVLHKARNLVLTTAPAQERPPRGAKLYDALSTVSQ